MIRFAALLVFAALLARPALAAEPTPASADVFAYDRSAPLDVREVGNTTRDGAFVRDVTFAGAKQAVKAYVVSPETPVASSPGVLYVHWLGDPATTNRTEFLNEAVALAGQGIVSVLVEAMWAAPKWYNQRVPEEDYARSVQQVIDLRRAMDFLLQQPGIDSRRVAFVGHDFGAMYGALAGALDRRAKTYVFMAGTPHFADWLLFAQQPKDVAAYRAQLAPLDPVRFLPQLAPAPIFFQFASKDEYVPAETAALTYAAALPRKQLATYDAGHDLQKPEVAADRIAWLLRELAAK